MDLHKINNQDFEAPLRKISSPLSPWQVYELGLTINNAASAVFDLLAENCSERKWVDVIRNNNQAVAETLQDRVFLHRNSELIEYYGSRGRISHGIGGSMNRQFYDIFADDVNSFLLRFNRFLERMKQRTIPFNPQEAGQLCSEITAEIGRFYQAIMNLYPPGETSAAIQDILQLNLTVCRTDLH